MTALEAVVGLEAHVRLATRTKLFCGCPSDFGAPPNTLVCPVCTGQPGALPVPNARAIELALRAGATFGCVVAETSRFDRKNYFYPDLPKGYQISQYDRPLCTGGAVPLGPEHGDRLVPLRRIHLEEDAGRTIHDRGDATLVDLNRAGTPLVEVVTEPAMAGADEAHACLSAIRELLRWVGVSDCDMEKGSLRCDVNVSLRRPGAPLGTKVELKNLNSLRHVRDGVEAEIARQTAVLAAGGEVVQETRLWDPERGETRTMRSKEEAEDYRYFPDPDLPPLAVGAAAIARARDELPELPGARRARWVRELGLSEYDAGVLSGSREVAELFEDVAARAGDAKAAANWIANDLLAAAADPAVPGDDVTSLRVNAAGLAELLALVAAGTVHASGARRALAEMLRSGRPAREVVRDLGLEQVRDEGAIEAWVRDALAANARAAEAVRGGNEKALGAIVGPVMKASGGRANPALVRDVALRLIRDGG